jgi:hypothetical protein
VAQAGGQLPATAEIKRCPTDAIAFTNDTQERDQDRQMQFEVAHALADPASPGLERTLETLMGSAGCRLARADGGRAGGGAECGRDGRVNVIWILFLLDFALRLVRILRPLFGASVVPWGI